MCRMNTQISEAVKIIGLRPLAEACGVSYQAVRKWEKNGMPRTEWTGETSYSETIESLCGGRVTKAQLLDRRAA